MTSLTGGPYYISMGQPVNGGTIVANWSHGAPAVVRGVVKGRPRVDINLYAPSRAVNPYSWTGDGYRLLVDALVYR